MLTKEDYLHFLYVVAADFPGKTLGLINVHIFQLGCLAFSLRFWPNIEQLV